MTTLRQAAQAVIERWDAPCSELPSTAQRMETLRTALEAPEQEPVGYAFANQDFIGSVIGAKGDWAPHEIPLYAAPVAAPDIKALQANGKGPAPCARFCEAKAFEIEIRQAERGSQVLQAKCDAFLANVNLLEVELEAMTAERDEYRTAADKMAAAHKIERDSFGYSSGLSAKDYLTSAEKIYELSTAGKMALKALEVTLSCDKKCSCAARIALAALKEAGVK